MRSLRMPILDSADDKTSNPIYPVRFYDDNQPKTRPCFQPHSQEVEIVKEPSCFDYRTPSTHYSMYPNNWLVIDHLESKQFDLALQLIKAAKGDIISFLRVI